MHPAPGFPARPPPHPPRSRRVPSSRELRPVPGGRRRRRPRGEPGGGGGSGRAAGNFGGERRPLPRGGRGSGERSLAGEEAAGRGGEAAGAGRGGSGGRRDLAAFPRAASPGAPLRAPAALRALPAAAGSERKRNAGLPAAGRRGQRAGNGGGRERGEARRQQAPRSGWSWEDAAAAAAATSPKGPGARRTLPTPGGIRLR